MEVENKLLQTVAQEFSRHLKGSDIYEELEIGTAEGLL